MITIAGPKTLYVDVDNTLVTWDGPNYTVNEKYVTLIQQFRARGHTIIVWSQGGAEWAASVVYEFNLNSYVTACISKPDWFADDKAASEFLPEMNRIYLPESLDK